MLGRRRKPMNLHFREYTLCGGRGRCHRVKRVFLSWPCRGLSICDYWGRLGIGGDWAQLPNVATGCKFTPRRVPGQYKRDGVDGVPKGYF
jgi:hypothetical protein